MKPWRLPVVSTLLLAGSLQAQAQAEQSGPTMHACLRAYSEGAQQARYLVTIDWNGMAPGQFHRFDIGAEDDADDTWPQLRDGRLRPRERPTDEYIVVSDVSRYPLQFVLLGFTRAATEAFDQSCQEGFCSLRLPAEGVAELGEGMSIASVRQAPRCP